MNHFRICLVICIFSVFNFRILAQEYTLNPNRLDVTGIAGDFMLSSIIVDNNSDSTITLHLKRIKKELPSNWTSCFCSPQCLAPFVDTLTFSILPNSSDSIRPNYNTDDTIPGTGIIVVTLYQKEFPDSIDTVTFTATTLPLGINGFTNQSNFSVYPNPFKNFITLQNKSHEPFSFSVYNTAGEMVFFKENISTFVEYFNLNFLPESIYFIRSENSSGNISLNKIVKY